MNKLFKNTLIAAAVASATLATANAATITLTGGAAAQDISQEGAASETSIALPNLEITLGDEYAVNDRLILTISGATVESQASASLTDAGGNITFGKLASTTDNTVIFRVTSLADDGAGNTQPTTNAVLTLSGITLDTDSVVSDAGDVTVTYSGQLSDGSVIESTTAITVVEVTSQFSASVTTPLNGIVDVNADRQLFTAAGEGTGEDSLVVTPAEVSGLTFAATATTLTHTLWGDFSYTDRDGDGDADASVTPVGTDDTLSAVTVADDFMSASFTQGVSGSIDAITVTLDAVGQNEDYPVMEPQTFSVSTDIAYTDNQNAAGSDSLLSEAAAGEWTLNGAQVFAPYVLVNSGSASYFITLANDGLQSGDIEVEAFDDNGMVYGPISMGETLDAGSTKLVRGSDIASLLGVTGFQRLAVTLTVNVPADDVTASGFANSPLGRQLIDVDVIND